MSTGYHIDDNNNNATGQCRLVQCCVSNSNLTSSEVATPPSRESTQIENFQHPSQHDPRHLFKSLLVDDNQADREQTESEKSISLDSNDNDENRKNSTPRLKISKSNALRGILKYPPGWRRRAVSESALSPGVLSTSDDTDGYFGTSLDSPDILFDFDDDDDDLYNDNENDKPKKCVTFSEKMATYLFRPNSSILGRRLKNQKKAKRKKDKRLRDALGSVENSPREFDPCFLDKHLTDDERTKLFIEMQRLNNFHGIDVDSSSEVSTSSGCETSASECSADEAESVADYEKESKDDTNKSKRKNRRKRNRKNKQNTRTILETGGYDSDF